jgi:hypothetical protein
MILNTPILLLNRHGGGAQTYIAKTVLPLEGAPPEFPETRFHLEDADIKAPRSAKISP